MKKSFGIGIWLFLLICALFSGCASVQSETEQQIKRQTESGSSNTEAVYLIAQGEPTQFSVDPPMPDSIKLVTDTESLEEILNQQEYPTLIVDQAARGKITADFLAKVETAAALRGRHVTLLQGFSKTDASEMEEDPNCTYPPWIELSKTDCGVYCVLTKDTSPTKKAEGLGEQSWNQES